MVEASPVKFYFAKYFFLVLGLLQWLAAAVIVLNFTITAKSAFGLLFLITLGGGLIVVNLVINEKIRRVAVGKNKIVVMEGKQNVRFEWPEVKSLKLVPFFNLYKLRLKGKKGSIYFFPSQRIDPAFGIMMKDTSKMGNIVEKRKKKFDID